MPLKRLKFLKKKDRYASVRETEHKNISYTHEKWISIAGKYNFPDRILFNNLSSNQM